MNNSSIFTNNTFIEDDNDVDIYGDECPLLGGEDMLARASKITALISIIAISLIGNMFLIVITMRTRRMRTTAYRFVVNMAIADLCTAVINMPESVVIEVTNTDEWLPGAIGVVLCKLLPFCQQVCAFCSILSLLIIALDRFFAINFPLRRFILQNRCKLIIATSWLIPCISSLPMLVANNIVESHGLILCLEEWPSPLDSMKSSRNYTVVLFVIFYLLPLIAISFLYGCVLYRLWKRKRPGNCSSSRYDTIFSRSKRKALKMFIAVVICFALCWLPFHVMFFIVAYDNNLYNCGVPADVYFVCFFFKHAISALNPCICMLFNKDYRDGFRQLIRNCGKH